MNKYESEGGRERKKEKRTHRPFSHTSSITEREGGRQTGVLYCSLALAPVPPLSGRSLAHDLQAASHLLHSQREAKPVSCALLLFPLHHLSSSLLFFFILSSLLLLGASGVKMMQEVSITVAYDAHVVERPGEEDTLACLVAHSRPLRTPRPVVGPFSRRFLFFFFCL